MPIIVNEIPPFLTTVLAGRTVEVGVGARISLVDETDQVILYGSFMFILTIISGWRQATGWESRPPAKPVARSALIRGYHLLAPGRPANCTTSNPAVVFHLFLRQRRCFSVPCRSPAVFPAAGSSNLQFLPQAPGFSVMQAAIVPHFCGSRLEFRYKMRRRGERSFYCLQS